MISSPLLVAVPATGLRGPQALRALSEIDRQVTGLNLTHAEDDGVGARAIVSHLTALLDTSVDLLVALQDVEHDRDGIADICFAGAFELRRVRRRLLEAHGHEAELVSAESARRKLRRAVRAVLVAGKHGGDAQSSAFAEQDRAELQAALSVRRLYARFRSSLRRPSDETAEAVLSALRYAVGALALLVGSPEYEQVRTADRLLLRRLRDRALGWARNGQPRDAGLELLQDAWTAADLLRGINQRQELRLHDVQLVAELMSENAVEPSGWFARLDPLLGLDDTLDALIERGRTGASLELAAEAVDRLRLLA
ncbi:MAG: hypothetical protein QM756_38690 [Polyangiaceae bacterium]